jgi:hypothetical protein
VTAVIPRRRPASAAERAPATSSSTATSRGRAGPGGPSAPQSVMARKRIRCAGRKGPRVSLRIVPAGADGFTSSRTLRLKLR